MLPDVDETRRLQRYHPGGGAAGGGFAAQALRLGGAVRGQQGAGLGLGFQEQPAAAIGRVGEGRHHRVVPVEGLGGAHPALGPAIGGGTDLQPCLGPAALTGIDVEGAEAEARTARLNSCAGMQGGAGRSSTRR
ncbi:hypothetical protein ACFQU2_39050 [Siccirubricoccus deserti]